MKKYEIETNVTRKYEVHFRAPDDKTAKLVKGKINEYLHKNKDMTGLITHPIIKFVTSEKEAEAYTAGVRELTVSNPIYSKDVRDPMSMQQEDIEIRNEVEWWNGNLNKYEIYDKLKDEFSESEQKKLINYAKEYFWRCKATVDDMDDLASHLGLDLEEDDYYDE